MRHRVTARLTTALALVAASLAWGLPAAAAVDGFNVTVGQQPGTFTVGKAARTLTAVVTTDRERRCRKVRWALTIQAEGVSLDQVRVNRVENNGTFRVRTRVNGDTAQLVDEQPDPGELCRDRTVTGRWDISFAGPDSGTVTFSASALDEAGNRELATASTTSRVVSPVAATPSATPSETTDPEEVADDQNAATDTPTAGPTSAAALNQAGNSTSVLGPGLIIGAVLVFLGVAILMRLRTRNRRETVAAPAWQSQTQTLPTGFYDPPGYDRR